MCILLPPFDHGRRLQHFVRSNDVVPSSASPHQSEASTEKVRQDLQTGQSLIGKSSTNILPCRKLVLSAVFSLGVFVVSVIHSNC